MLTDQLTLIKEYLGRSPYGNTKLDSIVGIEFENELPEDEMTQDLAEEGFSSYSNWKFHSENSLRHIGFEYVSKPLRYEDYRKQVKGLFDNLRKKIGKTKLPFTNSIRTSVHVHFEVLNYNTLDIINFACLYWIMEPFLQHFCGRHRQGNLFCVRLRDSGYTRAQLSGVLQNYTVLFDNDLINENYRYGSVNFNSISKFGTIEFRMMRGVSHERPACIWIDALEKIRLFALTFKNPQELRDWYLHKTSAGDVPITILGEELYNTLAEYLPEGASVTQLIRDGYFSTLPVLNAQDDFSEARLAADKLVIEQRKKDQEEYMKSINLVKKKMSASTLSWVDSVTSEAPAFHYYGGSTDFSTSLNNPVPSMLEEHAFVESDQITADLEHLVDNGVYQNAE